MASGSSLSVSDITKLQLSKEFVVDGRKIVLIDTPAIDVYTQSAPDALEMIAAFLETRWVVFVHFALSTHHLDRSRGRSTLGGFLYLHRVSCPWVMGMSTRHLMMFRELCGRSTLENVIIVTTGWDHVSLGDGEVCESALVTDFFKPALDDGAKLVRYRVAAQQTAHDIIRRVTQNLRTSPEPNEQIRRHQDELKAVREEMIKVLRDQEQILRREFEQEIRRVREQARVELERVRVDLERARVESEQEIRKAKEQTRVELEQELHAAQEQARAESEQEVRKVREYTRNRGGLLFSP